MSRQLYSIKLYRSAKFKILHFMLFFVVFFHINVRIALLFPTKVYSYDPFSKSIFSSVTFLILCFFMDLFLFYTLSFLLYCSVFFNRISVRENSIITFFAPCLFYRQKKCNINSITAIKAEDLKWYQRILHYNFEKNYLYKISCRKHNFIISSKDAEGMEKLMLDINTRNNPSKHNDTKFKTSNFSVRNCLLAFVIIICIIRVIYCLFNII